MKKLKIKLSLNRSDSQILNQLELNQLKGGEDIYNTNSLNSCDCPSPSNNNSVIPNHNSVLGCTCDCSS